MNDIKERENIKIENLIYEIKGKQVMFDSDLAILYKTSTKRINEAVKNNIDKFPERFCFKITEEETRNMVLKKSNSNNYGGSRKGHTVFTEQGVYMLATILKSKVATNVTIAIMDAFVLMKSYVSSSIIENAYYKEMLLKHDTDIKLLKEKFKTVNNHIFFEGQIYDAYSLLIDILKSAKKQIIIIDNYAGKELLDIIKNVDIDIKLYSKNVDEVLKNKYEKQYQNVEFIFNNSFHDRFIIIDDIILYHCGSSFKDLGKKCFAINRIEDKEILSSIINEINS